MQESVEIPNYHDHSTTRTLKRTEVVAVLDGSRAIPVGRVVNYFVIGTSGRRFPPKDIVHGLLNGFVHHGHAAAKALMDLGFTVYYLRPTKTQAETFGEYLSVGLLRQG
jgi:hypothetical protein